VLAVKFVMFLLPFILVSAALAAAFLRTHRSDLPLTSRRSAVLGLLALALLFILGVIFPSVFTLIAILALPAFLVLAYALVRPPRLRRGWRIYVAGSVLMSPVSFVLELLWLLSR